MRWLYLILLFIALGLVGAFPALLLAYFFTWGEATIAWQIYGLGAIILASWLPLKGLIDSRVKQKPLSIVFPQHINSLAVSFAFVAFLFLIPFMYFNTAVLFFLSIVLNSYLGFPLALVLSLALESVLLYRDAMREKELGISSTTFMNFQQMGFNDDMIVDVQRQAPRPYESEMIILPPLLEDSYEEDYEDDELSQSNSSES